QRATEIAQQMVTEYGMSEKIGPVRFAEAGRDPFLGRSLGNDHSYSEAIAHEIDIEIQSFINDCYVKAKQIITENREKLELFAEKLLEFETLDREDIVSLWEKGVMPEVTEEDLQLANKPEVAEEAEKEEATEETEETKESEATTFEEAKEKGVIELEERLEERKKEREDKSEEKKDD